MGRITADSLMMLETYAKVQHEVRARMIAHKKNRKVHLGEHVTLIFEDELTVRYQIQEMLRAEKIFEEAGTLDGLDAYGSLVPDGSNWKATMMLEFSDSRERAVRLKELIAIEDRVYIKVHNNDSMYAIADEDLDRETDEKTASVHFFRLELSQDMILALRDDAPLSMDIDHVAYPVPATPIAAVVRASLVNDLYVEFIS